MNYEKGTCSDCGNERYIYHKKNNQCQYCWKKDRSKCWIKNSSPKKQSKITIKSKGKKTIKEDDSFYKELWNEKPHVCEECGKSLGEQLSKAYISHILSKGAFPKLRYDKENINILCFEHHQQWEFGKRDSMKIRVKNEQKITILKNKYSRLSTPFLFTMLICMNIGVLFG